MKMFLIGVVLGSIAIACGSGSSRPNFDKFPLRSDQKAIWQKCENDETGKVVCQKVCLEYTRKNKCKEYKKPTPNLEVKAALKEGYVMIHSTFLLELLKKAYTSVL